ncbi:MAG: CaiB/BaiF CoA-transferase family protein, partial [Desulfobacterales bacterium]
LPIGDVGGGMMAALAIVSALNYRHATGKGQKLDISLMDTQISLASYMTAYWLIGGKLSGPQGSRHGNIVPYEAFQTKDSWLVVACATEKFWEGLCIAMDLDHLILDNRFNHPVKRVENRDDLIPILREKFLTRTGSEWLARLEEADVPCAPVNSLDLALSDPQVLARNMVVDIHDPELGDFKLAGNPIKASETEPVFDAPPKLGAHTVEVLKDILDYSDEQIAGLLENDVIGVTKESDDD